MALNQIIAGQQAQGDANAFTARGGRQGETLVSDLHGGHYEQAYRGNLFSICTQGTAVTTTAALATTWTGLGISNPAGSGVNLVLLKFQVAQFAVGAAATIGLMGGTGVLTATLTPRDRRIGYGTTSLARGSATDTISTPLLIATFGQIGSLATTGYGLAQGLTIDIGGALIIPPGSFIASYTSVVTTSALQFNYLWEEVPI
jgi:hypothetical protein